MENLVDLAVDRRQSELAARLLGAADMLYERIGAVRSPEQALDYERQVAALHGQIHNQDFAAAWSRGRSTPIDRMLAQAIDEIRLEALQKGETYGAR